MEDENYNKKKYGVGIHTINGRVIVVEGRNLKRLEGEVVDYSHPFYPFKENPIQDKQIPEVYNGKRTGISENDFVRSLIGPMTDFNQRVREERDSREEEYPSLQILSGRYIP